MKAAVEDGPKKLTALQKQDCRQLGMISEEFKTHLVHVNKLMYLSLYLMALIGDNNEYVLPQIVSARQVNQLIIVQDPRKSKNSYKLL